MTDKPIIGETTHILDDDAQIRTLKRVIENYEAREEETQKQFNTIRGNLLDTMQTNAELKNDADLWRGLAIVAGVIG